MRPAGLVELGGEQVGDDRVERPAAEKEDGRHERAGLPRQNGLRKQLPQLPALLEGFFLSTGYALPPTMKVRHGKAIEQKLLV